MDLELAKLIGTGGVAASLLFLIYLVGNRLVVAIRELVSIIREHTTKDLEHHAQVKTELVAMRTEMKQALDIKGVVQEAVDEVSGVHETAGEWHPKTPPYGVRRRRGI
jgi:hypothetical protein